MKDKTNLIIGDILRNGELESANEYERTLAYKSYLLKVHITGKAKLYSRKGSKIHKLAVARV